MSDLFFSKNRFVNNEPTKLAKPIEHDPSKLGRRTVDDIKFDMHTMNKPEQKKEPIKVQPIRANQNNQMNSLKAFREWNKK